MLRYEPEERSPAVVCLAILFTTIRRLSSSDDSQSSEFQTPTHQSFSRPHIVNVDTHQPINQSFASYHGAVKSQPSWFTSNSVSATIPDGGSTAVLSQSVARQKEPEHPRNEPARDTEQSDEGTGGSVSSASKPRSLAPEKDMFETSRAPEYKSLADAKRDEQEAVRRGQ